MFPTSIPVFLPASLIDKKMQKAGKAIAQVFSDMDSEIVSIQTQLSKYKLAKQGVMHSLLTGKVPLVNHSDR